MHVLWNHLSLNVGRANEYDGISLISWLRVNQREISLNEPDLIRWGLQKRAKHETCPSTGLENKANSIFGKERTCIKELWRASNCLELFLGNSWKENRDFSFTTTRKQILSATPDLGRGCWLSDKNTSLGLTFRLVIHWAGNSAHPPSRVLTHGNCEVINSCVFLSQGCGNLLCSSIKWIWLLKILIKTVSEYV